MSESIQLILDGIDATLADIVPIADAAIIEEEAIAELHELVESGWVEASEEQLVFDWFRRHRLGGY